MNVGSDENTWRTPIFRNNVVQNIEKVIRMMSSPINKTSVELENQIFQKARSKEEYLQCITKVIFHLRGQVQSSQQMPAGGQPKQDPMNALRAMTQPASTGNQMMNMIQQPGNPQLNASNLLQTFNQKPNLQNRMAGIPPGVRGPMGSPMCSMQQAQSGPMINQGSPIPRPAVNMHMNQQVPSPVQCSMQSNQMNMAQINHMAQRKMVPDRMMMPNQGNMYVQSRGSAPINQYIRQNSPSSQPSPVAMNPVPSMVPSPVLAASPNPTQMPNTGGMVSPMRRQAGSGMVPSPTLNTPCNQSQPTPSPCGHDEQAYRDKIRELSCYIEPLRNIITRSGAGDCNKIEKMKKLLEILSSPGHKVTLDTLIKCEGVLKKLDIEIAPVQPETQSKQEHPLLDAISVALQNPHHNHTFHRTFEPIMTSLHGKPLKNLPRPLKRKYGEDTPSDIPQVLQGEIARLNQKFKVSLDPVHHTNGKAVHLICWLDDKHLPCIPPVQITIPDNYPASSPKCDTNSYGYGATKFLQMIQAKLQAHISRLPSRFTFSQLLDAWELSVRETCANGGIFS